MKEKRRIAIFAFYDEEGVVDRYVEYLLTDLRRHLEKLVIVCNGVLQPQMRDRLAAHADCVLERENKGFDIWGYKAGIDMLGWEEICRYDELVLCNDSVFGPVYPFCEMFEEMDSREIDFWGITKHCEVNGNPFSGDSDAGLPEHIQSYFMVYRINILRDVQFQEYWAKLPMLNSYEEAVSIHESAFTARLSDLGYAYDVYVDVDKYREYTPNALRMCPDTLISENRCPVIKKRIFLQDYGVALHDVAGGAPARLMRLLNRDTDYDTDLIWEHILRIGRLDQIMYNLQLQYILNGDNGAGDGELSDMAIIFQSPWPEENRESLPRGVTTFMMTMEQLKAPEGEKMIGQYEFICLLPEIDRDLDAPGSSTMDLRRARYDNLIGDRGYLLQVRECFRRYPWLGILSPPLPEHGSYVKNQREVWQGGWFRREALREMLRTGIEGIRGTHHSLYAAVVYNQAKLQGLLNNQLYHMEGYRHLCVAHETAVREWQQTDEQLTAYREAHDRVVAEWQQTDEQLAAYREAHDRVVREWTETAEALRQLQGEYEALKAQKSSGGLVRIFKGGAK